MLEYLKETLYLGDGDLTKPLRRKETLLGSDMFSRVERDKVTVYYLTSSDQLEIPGEYINLFQTLNTRDGERLRDLSGGGPQEFISIGIRLPGIFLSDTDSRGIRHILGRMITIGTKGIRKLLPTMRPWILMNINNTIEI